MKNTGRCPKCDGNNLIRIPGCADGYGAGNNIKYGITIFSYIKVTRYVCSNCGFSEEWIDEKSDIDKLVEKYGNHR